ncbi:DUF1345 domain-containing protein [Nonomuraea sp. NPDC050556]|uniref:DUF1345 domain-containing protein n=1 Tax=Nonomuraea sp. NPDC050556 TaxID=3364369 RepID=UPI0037925F59
MDPVELPASFAHRLALVVEYLIAFIGLDFVVFNPLVDAVLEEGPALTIADGVQVILFVAWLPLSLLYLGIGWFLLGRGTARDGLQPQPSLLVSIVPPMVTASVGVVMIVLRKSMTSETLRRFVAANFTEADLADLQVDDKGLVTVLGYAANVMVVCVILTSWFLLHVGYARVYASRYLMDGAGIRVPGVEQPNMLDIIYVSLTIGVSFATSDVELTTRKMRRLALAHSVMSFFYNAAIVAFAFGMITQS